MAGSSSLRSLTEVLESWGVGNLSECFEGAGIDLKNLHKLDERTARSVLTPGAFLDFWQTFEDRKHELAGPSSTNKRKRDDSNVDDQVLPISDSDSGSDSEQDVSDDVVKDVKHLFTNTFVGDCLLNTPYEERTESDRNRIAEIVVTTELNKTKPVGDIRKKRLVALSQAVEKVFESEDKHSFYVPYKKVNNTVFAAKGKLTNQYYYWRQKGVKAGILHSFHSKEKPKKSAAPLRSDEEKSLKWLSVNLGPLPSVLEHWKVTHHYRMALLDMTRVDQLSIPEYYAKFPVLRQPEAVLLFKQDYENLYAGTENNLSANFNQFADKLLKKLKKVKDLEGSWLDKLGDYLEQGLGVSVSHHFFSCLSNLFTPQVVVKGRKPNNWTATKPEMQRGFLLHVGSDVELEKYIDSRVARLSSFKKPLGFTPFPVIVGKDLQSIEKCLVIVQPGERYPVKSPEEAIDVAFKAYHALCVMYPHESKNMWLLVQQKIYNVYTDNDEVPPSLIPTMKYFS